MTQEQIDQVNRRRRRDPRHRRQGGARLQPARCVEARLPRDVYPEIFRGAITNWRDARIVAANPDANLPDMTITVVRRSDGAGTNFIFTNHLSAIDETFRDRSASARRCSGRTCRTSSAPRATTA
jgi:hypothetical protein